MSDEFSDFEDEEGVEEPALSGDEQTEDQAEEVVEENPLSSEIIASCLSLLCKTGNGLSHAYVRLDIHQKEITDIGILMHFIHLRYVDISGNKLKDINSLNYLQHLLTLKADQNLLKSAKLNELPYLQHADFSGNKITDTEGINHPMLEMINLNNNEITEIEHFDPSKLSRLSLIELRGNKLTTTQGLMLPNIQKIFLGENMIVSIIELSRLEHLTTLHLRQNNISSLDGFSEQMRNLQYLNLRKNNISSLEEVNKLKCLPMLRALILKENPLSLEETYRIEVLVMLRRLERLDTDTYSDEERAEAEEISNQRTEEDMAGNDEEEGAEVIHSDAEEDEGF